VPRPAAGAIPIAVEVTATRRENAGRVEALPPAEKRRCLAPDRLVPVDGRIAELAGDVTRGMRTDREKARAIYDHVTTTMRYDKSGSGWGRGDALRACDVRSGNCTDFHSLIIGLARAAGIPARFGIGVSLPHARGEGEIPGYHCWAELYVDGAWLPVDSSEAAKNPAKKEYFFGHHGENRLQLSTGRDLRLEPPPAQGPVNFLIYPVVEIDGKPHNAIEHSFRFADLHPR
jgi:transglutaminase-like putative cysteine protease